MRADFLYPRINDSSPPLELRLTMATKKKTQKKLSNTTVKKTKSSVMRKKASKKVTKKVVVKAAKVVKKTAKKVTRKATKKTLVKRRVATSQIKLPDDDSLIHGIKPYKQKAREKYMSVNQAKHFREILFAWKANLLDEVSKTIHLMQDENINHPDPNDRASQETDMSLELRNRDRERKLLKKIDSTVAMIDTNDYGWCERCGVEIGIRRLEARPTADLCVDCKTLNEIKERQMV